MSASGGVSPRFDVLVSALSQGRLTTDIERFRPTHVLSLLDPGRPAPEIPGFAPGERWETLRFADSLVAEREGAFNERAFQARFTPPSAAREL